MKIISLITFISILFPSLSLAAQPSDVVINEICWMGNEVSANDEWIELYNNINLDIDLDGWKLIAKDGTPEIILKGKVNAKGFFLLERTDDDSASDAPADQIYKGALNNEGEFLQLIDGQGNIIDEVDCSGGWFSGDNKTKQTMERIGDNWQISQNPEGTPKAENSLGPVPNKKGQAHRDRPLLGLSPPMGLSPFPEGIIINEILPSPEGPDAENEYVEIFNQNSFEVDVSEWSFQDTEGSTKIFVLPVGTKIGAKNYLVFFRPQTKITLNNSGDGVQLLQPNKEVTDEINYGKASQGESFNRMGNDWFWNPNLTPGAENNFGGATSEIEEGVEGQKETKDQEEQKGLLETKGEELLGTLPDILSQQSPMTKNFFFILSIALIIALVSGILILILKKKLKSKKETKI